jgi:excisionase family DNA binding protein
MTHSPDPMCSPPPPMVMDREPSAAPSPTYRSDPSPGNQSEHPPDKARGNQVPSGERALGSQIPSVDERVFEPLLSAEQAAALLGGIHPKTLMRWARSREIPGYQIGRAWFFRASQLNHWLLTSGKIRPANMPA